MKVKADAKAVKLQHVETFKTLARCILTNRQVFVPVAMKNVIVMHREANWMVIYRGEGYSSHIR